MHFYEFFKALEVFEIKNTHIWYSINHYLRKREIKHYDKKNIKISEHNYNKNEKKMEEILGNNYLQNNTNVTKYILDLINAK